MVHGPAFYARLSPGGSSGSFSFLPILAFQDQAGERAMAEISIGGAVGEGFTLIRTRFPAVMVWGLLPIGLAVLTLVLLGSVMAQTFSQIAQARLGAAGPPPNLQAAMQAQALSYLTNIISLFVNAIVSCAVFRAVLKPEQNSFAYLRVGAPELLLGLYLIGLGIGLGIGIVVAMIPVGIVIAILAMAHLVAVAIIVGVLLGIAAICALIYGGLRLSLVGPMLVDEGRLELTEAWRLTKGRVVSLLAIGLLLMLILMVGEILVLIVMGVIGIGSLAAIAGGLQNLQTLAQQPAALFAKLVPLIIGLAVLFIPIAGCASAIVSAPWARAYRDLKPKGDIAATFA
jgi:hypothetical protein